MRVRASITLPKELLETADKYAKRRKETRSAFIEAALRAFIDGSVRSIQNARDLEIINQHADSLNHEAVDISGYST